jgi:hypothetical protein
VGCHSVRLGAPGLRWMESFMKASGNRRFFCGRGLGWGVVVCDLRKALTAAVDIADFWWQFRRIVAFCKSRVSRMDRTTGENDDVY